MAHEIIGGCSDMGVEVEPSCQYLLHFVVVVQIAAEEQSDKPASDMKMHMKQRSAI